MSTFIVDSHFITCRLQTRNSVILTDYTVVISESPYSLACLVECQVKTDGV
jgi:hypothetical protein